VAIILERELATRPESVVDVVRAATRDLRDALDLRVRVHPDDVPAVQGRVAALRSEQRCGASLRVHGDPDLSRGACRVESELGVIDASLHAQLDALARAIAARPGAAPAGRIHP
jgi:type III secretion protein L